MPSPSPSHTHIVRECTSPPSPAIPPMPGTIANDTVRPASTCLKSKKAPIPLAGLTPSSAGASSLLALALATAALSAAVDVIRVWRQGITPTPPPMRWCEPAEATTVDEARRRVKNDLCRTDFGDDGCPSAARRHADDARRLALVCTTQGLNEVDMDMVCNDALPLSARPSVCVCLPSFSHPTSFRQLFRAYMWSLLFLDGGEVKEPSQVHPGVNPPPTLPW